MTQRNEQKLVEARKQFYQNQEVKDKWLKIGEFAGMMHDGFIIFNYSPLILLPPYGPSHNFLFCSYKTAANDLRGFYISLLGLWITSLL